MSKYVKGMMMQAMRDRLDGARDLLVVDCSRLDAITANQWRLALQEKGIRCLGVKNALARRTLEEDGIGGLDDVLKGPSTLVFGGEDIVSLSKEITKWAKELEPLEIKGGTVEGSPLDAKGVEALSKSPSREELISQIAGAILSPGANLAAALLGPGKMLASQVKQVSEKDEE